MSRSHHQRKFYEILHMGNCQPNCTEARILNLYRILDKCLEDIGGLQQPPHSESKEEAERNKLEDKLGWLKVEDMVRDIAMALTGKEIEFKEK
jgi:hypothetical protein